MKVLKFGGSSVSSPERVKNVVSICKQQIQAGEKITVVVSAFGGVTDDLVAAGNAAANPGSARPEYKDILARVRDRHLAAVEALVLPQNQSPLMVQIKLWFNDLEDVLNGVFLVGELSVRCLDYIMSFGELLSALIISEAFKAEHVQAQFLDARRVIRSDNSFGCGNVNFDVSYKLIQEHFGSEQDLQIVTGFIAATENGDTITLGRGGSDYTAAIFAAGLNASVCEIWTDVDGIMTCDPRKVKKAFPQPEVSYEEAMELSHFGAKVIYPPTMRPALNKQIPIVVRNTFNAEYPGTVVRKDAGQARSLVSGISSIDQIALIRIQGPGMVGIAGVAARLFSALARMRINVILITQASSEHTICVAVKPEESRQAAQAIEAEFSAELIARSISPIVIEEDLAIVSVVGEGMRRIPGVAGKVFSSLGKHGINIVAIAQGSSELNISAVISSNRVVQALNALHEEFFFPETKSINVFLCGTGLIGSALLRQISEHQAYLSKHKQHEVKLVGVCNRRHLLTNEAGLDPAEAIATLQNTGTATDDNISVLIRKIDEFALPNSVFVDCTASEQVTALYQQLLEKNISIVTPNKRAQSGNFEQYQLLKKLARKKGCHFLYETSVGAGLPVINTLNDLLNTGDEVIRIEGVLSGTLSYIFNTFSKDLPFSQVVRKAQELGYTEPDPRDDLNGIDVARKILILARESGIELELNQVEVENLVPEAARAASTVQEFLTILEKHDQEMAVRIEKAQKQNQVLRYIAAVENNRATVELKAVGPEHPFYFMSGSDNIISFTTRRYRERPLVVKGPGAGAEVTAAGVFADVIRISA